MSGSGPDVTTLLGELTRTVEDLQSELARDARPPLRPPTPGDLARFTSEVTIPAVIIVLETNVRALKLLQRTLRLAQGRDEGVGDAGARERAESLGRATLSRLDDALGDLQGALEGRPADDEARRLLEEARDLRRDIDARLAPDAGAASGGDVPADRRRAGADETVDVDVESELRSIKDDVDDDSDRGDGPE